MFDRVTTDPLALSEDLRRADDRLLATVADLSPAELAAPSILPGWTRGHVVTHLARNADAFVNLLTWARTGVETPAYASVEARAAGIEAGASRPLDEQIADVRDACARLSADIAAMPADAWAYVFNAQQGSAARITWRRLREVEMHHVDLGLAYTTADWPEAFTARLLRELVTDRPRSTGTESPIAIRADSGQAWQLGTGSPDVTVTGPAHELAGWLAGRSDGSTLTVSPPGPIPIISDWM
jgi:maleylpyruvate isomerase